MTKYHQDIDLVDMKIIKARHGNMPTLSEMNENCDFIVYNTYTCHPATGIVYLTDKNRYFLSGHARMRGEPNGSYPHFYTEMIDYLFGPDENTIECCAYKYKCPGVTTLDINPEYKTDICGDAQNMQYIKNNTYTRWRADPPYNKQTAKSMYNCELPNTMKLLKEASRIVKPKSLLFLLLGPKNQQACPRTLKRIGIIFITVVPNNEIRALNIYYKLSQEQIRTSKTKTSDKES